MNLNFKNKTLSLMKVPFKMPLAESLSDYIKMLQQKAVNLGVNKD